MAQVVTRQAEAMRPGDTTMSTGPLDVETTTDSRGGLVHAIERALTKFLVVPLGILLGFLVAGIVAFALDRANPGWIEPVRSWLMEYVFPTSQTTGSFLGTVAGGLLTQTSIVISMLLIVLQNTATKMGNLVYDQFMSRRRNQIYVGYVIGSVILALFLRSTVSDTFNPVLGGAFVFVVMFFSMALLAWFLYTTMNQMKPEVVVNDIHSTAMSARKSELRTLLRTRRKSISPADVQVLLRSTVRGYVTNISLDKIDECLQGCDPATEVVIHAIVGDFVSYHDMIASIRTGDQAEARQVAQCVGGAFTLARERDPRYDPRFNLEQYEMVAWTEGSTAKHNPETPVMVIHSLRDLLRRWTLKEITLDDVRRRVPVVYPDKSVRRILDALESIAVVSTESKQHQVYAEVLEALALTYRDLPPDLRDRADSLLRRVVPGLSQHLYTRDLETALDDMVFVLRAVGNDETAQMLARARSQLAKNLGQVSSGGKSGGGGGSGSSGDGSGSGGGGNSGSSGSGGSSGKSS